MSLVGVRVQFCFEARYNSSFCIALLFFIRKNRWGWCVMVYGKWRFSTRANIFPAPRDLVSFSGSITPMCSLSICFTLVLYIWPLNETELGAMRNTGHTHIYIQKSHWRVLEWMDLCIALDIQSHPRHLTYRNDAKIIRSFIAQENLMITPLESAIE